MRPIQRQREAFAYRVAAPVNQDVATRLGDEFHQWWKDSGYTWDPHERGDDDERGPMGDWPTIEEFLEERYPAAHRGLMMGQEIARPLLDGVGRGEEALGRYDSNPQTQRNFNMLQIAHGDNVAPYETGPEAQATHGYDPREVAAAFLLLHNKTHPLRGYRADEDQARLNEIAQARNAEFDNADIDVLHDIAQKRHKMQHTASSDYDDTAWWAAGWDDEDDDDDDEPLHKHAMPAEDAYDGNWKNRKTSPPVVGPFYHSSDHDLPDGTILLPNQGESKFTDDYERRPGWKERTKWVWMELDPSGGWGEHTYEVEPMDEGPWPWNGDGRTHGYTSPRARIIRKMTPEDQQELMDAFVDRMHEENRHLYAHRTAMPRMDAYDLDSIPVQGPDQTPVLPGPWYHASPHKLQVGDILDPHHKSPGYRVTYDGPMTPRDNWVFLHPSADYVRRFGDNLYQVEPLDEGPWSYNEQGGLEGHVSPRARIIKIIPNKGRGSHPTPGPGAYTDYRDYADDIEFQPYEYPKRKTAMPALDAYDSSEPQLPRVPAPKVPQGKWYHASPHDLPDDTVLVPGGGRSQWGDEHTFYRGWEERPNWVWMSENPDLAKSWGRHIYEIEPLDDGPWPWNGPEMGSGYVSPRARIVRKLTQEELYPEQKAAASRTAMPAPLPEGITFHYHPDDSTIPAKHYDDFYAPAIEARHHGNYVGHLSWTDGSPEDGGRPVGEINHVKVIPDYQRHGVATAMFDYVRQQHEPAIHHSGFLSADGRSWRDYEESRHKTAMPAPLPEGVTFKYHHTNDSIPEGYSGINQGGSHTFLAPAVAAYKNDKPVAYVEWWPTDKYPNAAKHFRFMDKGKPGEVYYIYVHPNYRRNSIASEMFRWAKDNVEPDLHHSPKKSELGKKWVSYEESTPELARAAAVIRYAQRVAMPLNHIPPMNHFDDRLFLQQLHQLVYSDRDIAGRPERADTIHAQYGNAGKGPMEDFAELVSFIYHDENGAPTGILHYFPHGSNRAREKPGGIQVMVHPAHQGKGIGSKLLDAAMAQFGPDTNTVSRYAPIDLDNQNVTPGGNALVQQYLKRTAE